MDQKKFNLEVIRDGLEAIAADTERQLQINKHFGKHIDDVFDILPLDYLPYLIENNVIPNDLSQDIQSLYRSINAVVENMEWREEDRFIAANGSDMKNFRDRAKSLLTELKKVNDT